MAEKVTVMVLKVDLQCSSCYKKIKNILCQCPKISGQIFDVKQNTVTINVVCCSPEKVRDKLICKAGKVIKSIEIIKEKEKEKEREKKSCEKEKEKEKSCEKEKEKKKSCNSPLPLPRPCCGPCSKGNSGGPCYQVFPVLPPCYHRYGCGCGCGRGYQLRKCVCVCYIKGSPSAGCGCGCGCGCGRGYQLRKCVLY